MTEHEEVVDKLPEGKGEGRLGLKVLDSDGGVKDRVEYRRVSGEGSVEFRRADAEVSPLDLSTAQGLSWLKRRRDEVKEEY